MSGVGTCVLGQCVCGGGVCVGGGGGGREGELEGDTGVKYQQYFHDHWFS